MIQMMTTTILIHHVDISILTGDEILCFGLDPNFSYEENKRTQETLHESIH